MCKDQFTWVLPHSSVKICSSLGSGKDSGQTASWNRIVVLLLLLLLLLLGFTGILRCYLATCTETEKPELNLSKVTVAQPKVNATVDNRARL
jgi:hypothetical protein